MESRFTPLDQLNAPAVYRLASLHIVIMHTLLSELGEPLVRRFYQLAQADPGVIGLCAITQTGEIAGWVMGSPDPAALNSHLRQPFGWFAFQLIRLAFTRPAALAHLASSLLHASPANALASAQIELTYIGVAPTARGRGLGADLLNAFCAAARQAGYTSVALSVETDNPAASRLYTRAGFTVTHTFREGRFMRQRMLLQLV